MRTILEQYLRRPRVFKPVDEGMNTCCDFFDFEGSHVLAQQEHCHFRLSGHRHCSATIRPVSFASPFPFTLVRDSLKAHFRIRLASSHSLCNRRSLSSAPQLSCALHVYPCELVIASRSSDTFQRCTQLFAAPLYYPIEFHSYFITYKQDGTLSRHHRNHGNGRDRAA